MAIQEICATREQIIQRRAVLQGVLTEHFQTNVESVQTEATTEDPIKVLPKTDIELLATIAAQLVLRGVYEFWLSWNEINGDDKRIGLKYDYHVNRWNVNIPSTSDNAEIEQEIGPMIFAKHSSLAAVELASLLAPKKL